MKTLNFKLFTILLIALGFAASCGKDEVTVSPFVGNYVITEAGVAESFNVPLAGGINFPIPLGTPITAAIQTALLSAVSCSSPDKTYIEIRKDFSLYMSCEGADELNAGTWSEVSSSVLLLNLNSTAVPSAPSGIALTVTDVIKSNGILTGITSVPLPKAMIAAALAAINPGISLDPSAPETFLVKFSLKFTQK
jgi:hypothetical protein